MTQNTETKTTSYAVETLRRLAASKLFIALAVAQGVRLIFEAVQAFWNNGAFARALSELKEIISGTESPAIAEIMAKLEAILPVLDSVSLAINLVGLICPVLAVIGMLALYFGAKKEDDYMASRGALVLRFMCFAQMAYWAAIIAEALFLIFSLSPSSLINAAFVLALLILALPFIFFIELARVLDGVECTFLGAQKCVKHSSFAIWASKIISGLYLASVVLDIIHLSIEPVALVLNICLLFSLFCLSELLKKYRTRLGAEEKEAETFTEESEKAN